MKIGIANEATESERRVALTPDTVKSLKAKSHEIVFEKGSGLGAGFEDDDFANAGATLVDNQAAVYAAADLIVRITPPRDTDIAGMRAGTALISFLAPASNLPTVKKLADQGVTSLAMELVPRITRAQSMDALSSMSTIAGYKAVLLAADTLPKFFPMFMTAAGTLPAAKVFVIGAGVAGLQAIATAKRLGAIVEAFDVRAAVKEQVESLGARFVVMPEVADGEGAGGYAKELSKDSQERVLELVASRLAKNDVVITTALIPGKPAPKLITRDAVSRMARGSVIVDLAAPAGGNCEATVPGQTVVVDGVTICGGMNMLSEMSGDASRMYGKNVAEILGLLAPEGELKLDMEDQVIREMLVTNEGKVVHEGTRQLMEANA